MSKVILGISAFFHDAAAALVRDGVAAMRDVLGGDLPVTVKSVTGSFNNPNITFTFTLANNRTYTFTGRMAENRLMTGKISGPTLPETTITFEKSITT